MQIEVSDYKNFPREGAWSHGLYVWLPERDLSFGRAKAGIFQIDFAFDSKFKTLDEVVAHYVSYIEANIEQLKPGKYNIRVLENFGTLMTITVKLTETAHVG